MRKRGLQRQPPLKVTRAEQSRKRPAALPSAGIHLLSILLPPRSTSHHLPTPVSTQRAHAPSFPALHAHRKSTTPKLHLHILFVTDRLVDLTLAWAGNTRPQCRRRPPPPMAAAPSAPRPRKAARLLTSRRRREVAPVQLLVHENASYSCPDPPCKRPPSSL